jgi:hypothetical protein
MFFDQQEFSMVTGMFAFSDFPYGDLPVQPSAIKPDPIIEGTVPGGRILEIGGSTGSN